ncbi:MAG: hypothetical protein ACI9F9_001546 [Candidatus Paceibacteria bacterium]|jgi:hypothetical protein
MSNSKLISALFLAAPAALFAGCSAQEAPQASTTGNTTESTQTEPLDNGSIGFASDEEAAASADQNTATETPVAVDEHAGHNHAPGEGHGEETSASTMSVSNPGPLGDGEGARMMYKVGSETHAFGRVMQGTVAGHTFELKNEGNEDLIIKQVKPTCGCTVAQVECENDEGEMVSYVFGDPISPGRRVNVPAKLHTKNKSGHQTTRINIFSNDPRGTIQLGLEADIDPFFGIAPRFLNFGQISVGDVVEKRAVISTTKGTPIGLSLVEQSLPAGAKCELLPVNPDGEGRAARWDLSVTLGPELTEGNLARAISITSDVEIPGSDPVVDGDASKYSATVTLSAQVVGPFSYNPPYLSMGLVRPGQVATRTVTVECHDGDFSFADTPPSVRIVGLQNPQADLGAEATFRDWEYADVFTPTLRPVEGKNAVEIELRLEGMPESTTGSFRGTLVVDLGHPDKKQIALVITGVCRGGPAK